MIVFPNCKINLGLRITGKRDDGYHDLQTIFYPVQINDALEIIRSDELKIFLSGNEIDSSENICMKAYRLLAKDHTLPPVHIHLHKNIPGGAGLGGGSADGSFTLALLNEKFNLGLSEAALLSYALQLGSDCPFFIINKPCTAAGRGEKLTPTKIDLSDFYIVVVHPGIHVSTAEAFKNIVISKNDNDLTDHIQRPLTEWKDVLINDFERTVSAVHPEIAQVKQLMYDSGALYASMSGSGSAVFGLFAEQPNINFPDHHSVYFLPGKGQQ